MINDNFNGTEFFDGSIEFFYRKIAEKPRFYTYVNARSSVSLALIDALIKEGYVLEAQHCYMNEVLTTDITSKTTFFWKPNACVTLKTSQKAECNLTLASKTIKEYERFIELVREISEKIQPVKNDSEFGLICSNSRGLFVRQFKIKKTSQDIDMFYNDDVLQFDKTIKQKLEGERNGIVLLHGEPGTGKTSYIRHLIATVGKDVLYLPPDLATSLSSPDFQTFILDNAQNKLLIIEDAENILMSRQGGGNQAVANILNMSDGILGDALRVQLLCTFNTKITDIDSALRRPGRLLGEHKFSHLTQEKAKALALHLYGEEGEKKVTKPLTVAEVFGIGETTPRLKDVKMPFGFVVDTKKSISDDDDYGYNY